MPRANVRRALCVHLPEGMDGWCDLFRAAAPDLDVLPWPALPATGQLYYVAAWNPPAGFFRQLASPRAIFVLGAGVERFLRRDDLPPDAPLIRLTDAGMAQQMSEYALSGVLRFQRNLDLYERQQAAGDWHPLPVRPASETRVTVLGLGKIGGVVAATLAHLGYRVAGWSRSAAIIPGVDCQAGLDALDRLLARTDVLVNILPSTQATRGLLDRERLGRLPVGAFVVNGGRGDQLDLEALVELLDVRHLRGALLDVFANEPLPTDSPLWRHRQLVLTPHVAAETLPEPSVRQVVENIRRLEAGEAAEGVVDRHRGY